MDRQDVAGRLAQYADGHRRLTNLRHLLELLQARAQSDHGMESLLQWLAGQRLDTSARGEACQAQRAKNFLRNLGLGTLEWAQTCSKCCAHDQIGQGRV